MAPLKSALILDGASGAALAGTTVLASQSTSSDVPLKAWWRWNIGQLESATCRDKKDRSELKAIDAILAGY